MKIPKQVSLERKRKVWELRQRNYTYEAIAQKVGISFGAVAKILQRLSKSYYERHLEDVDRIKAEQIATLDHISYEAFQAWERSKETAKLVRQKKAISATGESLGVSEQTLESRDQDGDPRYLQIVIKSKEDIRKIVGADAPFKSEITGKDGGPITVDERVSRINALLAEGKTKRDSETPISD